MADAPPGLDVLTVRARPCPAAHRFDLEFPCGRRTRPSSAVGYSTELFYQDTFARLADHYRHCSSDRRRPDAAFADCRSSLAERDEQSYFGGQEKPGTRRGNDLFEACVATSPDATAVVAATVPCDRGWMRQHSRRSELAGRRPPGDLVHPRRAIGWTRRRDERGVESGCGDLPRPSFPSIVSRS